MTAKKQFSPLHNLLELHYLRQRLKSYGSGKNAKTGAKALAFV